MAGQAMTPNRIVTKTTQGLATSTLGIVRVSVGGAHTSEPCPGWIGTRPTNFAAVAAAAAAATAAAGPALGL